MFDKTKAVLVASPKGKIHLSFFEAGARIKDYPKLQVALDSSEYIDKVYNYVFLPQITIYDKNRRVLKIFNGDTPIDSLKKYIQ
jgi:hypothetical protein